MFPLVKFDICRYSYTFIGLQEDRWRGKTLALAGLGRVEEAKRLLVRLIKTKPGCGVQRDTKEAKKGRKGRRNAQGRRRGGVGSGKEEVGAGWGIGVTFPA
ncbi:hypothetical protein E2C01_085359 [Portunus trituberculatus]|uniref:Uncharacterized protein n=1 Tax=Portunus trituberculatus TaxID=210409 RepID=A0A5B7JBQ5_PORTR|nr:hypothetical protein [Portunus trituberculatus]